MVVPCFNIAGPCIPGEHYMLPPERRLGRVQKLIEQRKYFTLHSGRQTGKTTSAMWLVDHLDAEGKCLAAWIDLQTAREEPEPARAFRTVAGALEAGLRSAGPELALPSPAQVEAWLVDPPRAILSYLRAVAAASPRPLVLLLDEADGLVGPAMVSFLTQLRDGYLARSRTPFPASIVLIGQRQVRDYTVADDERTAVSWLGTTSPFNISAEAATLGPFTEAEVGELLGQHTVATGQRFAPDAVARVYELGRGHPWLTNALADQVVNWDVEDRSAAVTAAHVEAAKETIIIERRSHIDSLIARLHEPRVVRILDSMLAGEPLAADVLSDDVTYALGLGLISRRDGGTLEVANPIYREVVPRALSWVRQGSIPNQPAWYVSPGGGLDMPKLMAAFQAFWREDGHVAAEGLHYRESGPHLVLMAFLQRVVNGGGRIDREYGLGRKALDILVTWRGERHAIELKIRRDAGTEARGVEQTCAYLDQLGISEGWLVLFDLRAELPWSERIFRRATDDGGKRVHVVGC